MNTSLICLVAGPVISGLTSLFKKISFIKSHPKVFSFGVSAVVGVASAVTGGAAGVGVSELAQCVLIPFAGAVATYEAVTRPVKETIIPAVSGDNKV